ncbi:hypothetical protein CtCNB1_4042 [Comamonas thiooxydans]|nr:hypothetical protein CtCNB1_4042 [Comamonas thiooxydans]
MIRHGDLVAVTPANDEPPLEKPTKRPAGHPACTFIAAPPDASGNLPCRCVSHCCQEQQCAGPIRCAKVSFVHYLYSCAEVPTSSNICCEHIHPTSVSAPRLLLTTLDSACLAWPFVPWRYVGEPFAPAFSQLVLLLALRPFRGVPQQGTLRRLFAKSLLRARLSAALAVHRGGLNGLDALPSTVRLVPACTAAPSCARARGYYVRFQRTGSRTGDAGGSSLFVPPCPTAVGAGVLAPPLGLPALGRLSVVDLVSPVAPPLCTCPPWASGKSLRPKGLRTASRASAAGAAPRPWHRCPGAFRTWQAIASQRRSISPSRRHTLLAPGESPPGYPRRTSLAPLNTHRTVDTGLVRAHSPSTWFHKAPITSDHLSVPKAKSLHHTTN